MAHDRQEVGLGTVGCLGRIAGGAQIGRRRDQFLRLLLQIATDGLHVRQLLLQLQSGCS